MSKITRIELAMIDLVPPVKRVDAIQSFVSQETPLVTIHDDEGNCGTGYSYTIGTGGHAVMALLEKTLAPALIGRDPERLEQNWRDLRSHCIPHRAQACIVFTQVFPANLDFGAAKTLRLHRQCIIYQFTGGKM